MKKNVTHQSSKEQWQIDEYAKRQNFVFTVPHQLLMLCKILNVTPERLLIDFMDNLACSSWKREGRDKVKSLATQYFIEHGYGRDNYSTEQIEQMFKEMDAMGLLYPKHALADMQELHVQWREQYNQYWFDKWFNKNKRQL